MPKSRDQEARSFARKKGLRYVSDSEPGFSRRRHGKKFIYLDHKQKPIKSIRVRERLDLLVIPPAWKNVWICTSIDGHLQVTGRDARDRKQYRYHTEWSVSRNENKFNKLAVFAKALPKIRRQLEKDLATRGMNRRKVLAAVVQILELTRIRVGNSEYSKQNDSYGLTTIRNDHARIKGRKVEFSFRGKSGVQRDVSLSDARLSKIIRACHDMPGKELFCYEGEDGQVHDINSSDVNNYIKEISGEDISAKDFRTWGGTVKALEIILGKGPCEKDTERAHKSRQVEVIKDVANYLGNTVAVCRKYYIAPLVFSKDQDGSLHLIPRKKNNKRGPYSQCEQLLAALIAKN